MEGGDKGRERDIGCADGGGRGQGAGAGYRVRGRCAVEGVDKGRERDIGCAVRGGGRGQGAGARYRVRGRCAVEGVDKGRERDMGWADRARGGRGQGAGARYRVRGRCAVEGVDKGRERGRCARGGSGISGARTVRGGGRGQGAGVRYRVRGRCGVEGVDKGRERDIGCADGARWRAWTRGGSATSGARTVHGGGRGQGVGARTVCSGGRGQGAGAGLPFCQYSLRLGFRVPGLTLLPLLLKPKALTESMPSAVSSSESFRELGLGFRVEDEALARRDYLCLMKL